MDELVGKKVSVHCYNCPYKRVTARYSSDDWDRMEDWVCSAHNDDKIASAVEWHEESQIKVDWCPLQIRDEEGPASTVRMNLNTKSLDRKFIRLFTMDSSSIVNFISELYPQDMPDCMVRRVQKTIVDDTPVSIFLLVAGQTHPYAIIKNDEIIIEDFAGCSYFEFKMSNVKLTE